MNEESMKAFLYTIAFRALLERYPTPINHDALIAEAKSLAEDAAAAYFAA